MTSADVLAVVVSYNGGEKLEQSVAALRQQVGQVLVVDNGSAVDSQRTLARVETLEGVTVERLGQNMGVGYALNRGVAKARRAGQQWLLTMDQDSIVDPNLVQAYRNAIESDRTLTCLTPCLEVEAGSNAHEGKSVRYAITSGNLVKVSVFDEVGLYDEGLFIDCVDFDFSLRIRRAGHRIHRVAGAHMKHQLGDSLSEVPPLVRRFYARHSPLRRYYMYRNYFYVAERYLLRFPGFVLKLGVLQAVLFCLIGFYDRQPWASYRSIARGMWDYAARRMGPYPDGSR